MTSLAEVSPTLPIGRAGWVDEVTARLSASPSIYWYRRARPAAAGAGTRALRALVRWMAGNRPAPPIGRGRVGG